MDRILHIETLDEPAAKTSLTKDFDIARYTLQSFTMFGGEDTVVQLIINKSLVNAMVDRFGIDVLIYPIDDVTARAHITIKASEAFFGWLAQFGTTAKIEKPAKLAEEYCEFLERIISQYH